MRLDRALCLHILRVYPSWPTRAYLAARLSIIRHILTDLLDNLPERGTVLNLGSGIGLFDLYCAHQRPHLRFVGIDLDATRVARARHAAGRLGLVNVEFVHGDVTRDLPDLFPDVVVALDILHHVSPAARSRLLEWSGARLRGGGVLFIKDISTERPWRVTFTKMLDDLMTRRAPTHYFSSVELRQDLSRLGFRTATFHLWDYIPFPHIIYVAHR